VGVAARTHGGSPAFLGALTGSSLDLLAILIGALVNAHLNRRRDDRLRNHEVRALATALQAELKGLHRTLVHNAKEIREGEKQKKDEAERAIAIPDLSRSVIIYPEVVSKLGVLDIETIQCVIDAYILVRQYGTRMVIRGGTRGSKERGLDNMIEMPRERAKYIIAASEGVAGEIEKTIKLLERYL
jgi:hypothetical protein